MDVVAAEKGEVTAMKMTQKERRRYELDEQANQETRIPVASTDHGHESEDE